MFSLPIELHAAFTIFNVANPVRNLQNYYVVSTIILGQTICPKLTHNVTRRYLPNNGWRCEFLGTYLIISQKKRRDTFLMFWYFNNIYYIFNMFHK